MEIRSTRSRRMDEPPVGTEVACHRLLPVIVHRVARSLVSAGQGKVRQQSTPASGDSRRVDMTFPTTLAVIEALRSRKISSVELVRQACERIEAHDSGLNAVVVRDFERAVEAARAADAAL